MADVDALRSRIAELEAAQAKGDADRAAAEKAAADKVEADRVAALSAEQKLQEAVLRQQGELDATRAELVAERRATALERLGVLPHFRDYAPKVDPKTADGAAALEKWAKTHPEALAARNGAAPVQAIKPIGALAEVLAGTRNSPLLRGTWAEAVLNSFKG
ncbi:MAG: hypothetical protein FJ191_12660 [Gammaproteobacteria bacterium]|nr:hypothetical protein [Gammaproteobacteria bacterium]